MKHDFYYLKPGYPYRVFRWLPCLYWRHEGQDILPGLNLFHPDDYGSRGFMLRLRKHTLRMRWSRRCKRWHIVWRKHGTEFLGGDRTEAQELLADGDRSRRR